MILAVLDLSESGEQIEEKLFVLLDAEQRWELIHYVLAKDSASVDTNRRQVMTFEMITDYIWGYDYDSVENMLGAIHNIMSRIKQKLRVEPDIPDYISSVRGIGYKFNK